MNDKSKIIEVFGFKLKTFYRDEERQSRYFNDIFEMAKGLNKNDMGEIIQPILSVYKDLNQKTVYLLNLNGLKFGDIYPENNIFLCSTYKEAEEAKSQFAELQIEFLLKEKGTVLIRSHNWNSEIEFIKEK